MMVCKRFKFLVVSSLLIAVATGCSSGSSFIREGYNFAELGKIGVVAAESPAINHAQRAEIADLFAMEVLRRGWDVIDRANLNLLVDENILQNESGITSQKGRTDLAAHNISAMVIVNVTQLSDKISMTAKMVEVDTASVLWIGEGTGNLKGGLSALAGGVIGGGAGAAAGSQVSGAQGALIGGGAGAAAGAVTGQALEPSEARVARNVIEKICRQMPPNRR